MFVKLVAASVVAVLAATPALADAPKSLGKSGAWESFAYSSKAGKVCYAASMPKKNLKGAKDRDDVFVTITHRPAAKSFDVVSVTGGYVYKKDAPVGLDVGAVKFELYAASDKAWARDDKAVVQALLKGKSMVVYGVPAKGEKTVDTYSLDGFAKAYAEIGKACGVK